MNILPEYRKIMAIDVKQPNLLLDAISSIPDGAFLPPIQYSKLDCQHQFEEQTVLDPTTIMTAG